MRLAAVFPRRLLHGRVIAAQLRRLDRVAEALAEPANVAHSLGDFRIHRAALGQRDRKSVV